MRWKLEKGYKVMYSGDTYVMSENDDLRYIEPIKEQIYGLMLWLFKELK